MKPYLFDLDTALITPRTVIRRFREGDGPAFHELFQDNHVLIEDMFPELKMSVQDHETAEHWVRYQLADWLVQSTFSFSIWEKEQAEMIGWIVVKDYREDLPAGRFDGFIDREQAGKGLMTEVVRILIPYCFEQLRLEKLSIHLAADNYAGQRLARKCEFHREGELRAEGRKPTGEIFDLVAFGLTRAEYEMV